MAGNDAFFELVRAGLWGSTPDPDLFGHDTDWKALLADAKRQRLVPLVADGLSRLDPALQPPQPMMMALQREVMATIAANTALNKRLAEVSAFYASNGVEGVLLKGQGVAQYYLVPELRQCGDIDFYVGAANFDKAVGLASTRWPEGHDHAAQETYKHYEFKADGVAVELHRAAAISMRPWKGRRFRRWMAACIDDNTRLRSRRFYGVDVNLPPVGFDAIYIFYHALNHLVTTEGVGLRQLCDWARVLHTAHTDADIRELEKTVRSLGLTRPWRIMGYILVNYLGLPAAEMPLYSDRCAGRADRLLAMIMQGGNFGQYSGLRRRPAKGYLGGKLETLRIFAANQRRMWFLSPGDVFGSFCWYTTTGLGRTLRHCAGSKD